MTRAKKPLQKVQIEHVADLYGRSSAATCSRSTQCTIRGCFHNP